MHIVRTTRYGILLLYTMVRYRSTVYRVTTCLQAAQTRDARDQTRDARDQQRSYQTGPQAIMAFVRLEERLGDVAECEARAAQLVPILQKSTHSWDALLTQKASTQSLAQLRRNTMDGNVA